MNQTTIVLSKEALDALFPVGSEARIQFANSAVKAFCEQQIKPSHMGDVVNLQIQKVRGDIVQEVLKDIGAIHTHRGIAFTDDFKAKLRAAAMVQMDEVMKEAIRESAKGALLTAQAQVSASVKDQVRLEANKAVREAVNQAVTAALTVAPK
jgi:hypothetical protein